MDKMPKDFDIEVYGITHDEFEYSMKKLNANGVGKAFFVYKYLDFDISLPRSEQKLGSGHKGFKVSIENDMKKACSRRDFTMNSMLIDLDSFELIDFFGGLGDIKSHIIKMTNAKSFGDDSLRALRAVQFSARLKFKIEIKTLEACKKIRIDDLPKERIYGEFAKLFDSSNPHFGLYYLAKMGLTKKMFGFELNKKEFLTLSFELKKAYSTGEYNKSGLFIYILSSILKLSSVKLHTVLGSPNTIINSAKIQKRVPKCITDRFLVGIAANIPLREWMGGYKGSVKERAQKLGIWDDKFIPGAKPQMAIQLGLKSENIGKYLRVQRAIEIRKKFE